MNVKSKRKFYTRIFDDVLRDKSLSNKALGLLCRMLSHSTKYTFSIASLCTERDGEKAIRQQLLELLARGYIERKEQSREAGRYGHSCYIVHKTLSEDEPNFSEQKEPSEPPPYAENRQTVESPPYRLLRRAAKRRAAKRRAAKGTLRTMNSKNKKLKSESSILLQKEKEMKRTTKLPQPPLKAGFAQAQNLLFNGGYEGTAQERKTMPIEEPPERRREIAVGNGTVSLAQTLRAEMDCQHGNVYTRGNAVVGSAMNARIARYVEDIITRWPRVSHADIPAETRRRFRHEFAMLCRLHCQLRLPDTPKLERVVSLADVDAVMEKIFAPIMDVITAREGDAHRTPRIPLLGVFIGQRHYFDSPEKWRINPNRKDAPVWAKSRSPLGDIE